MVTLDDDDAVVRMTICISSETAERLLNLSNICHAAPDKVAASLLHDVLAEDQEAHQDQTVPIGATIQ